MKVFTSFVGMGYEPPYQLIIEDLNDKRKHYFSLTFEETKEYAKIFLAKAEECKSEEDFIPFDLPTDRGLYRVSVTKNEALKIGYGLQAITR